jgi:Centromere protein Scm3
MADIYDREVVRSNQQFPPAERALVRHDNDLRGPECEDDRRRQVEKGLLQNELRYGKALTSIIEKFGRNFDGVGDEIDLETGEIVVDNGHLQRMQHEHDAGSASNVTRSLLAIMGAQEQRGSRGDYVKDTDNEDEDESEDLDATSSQHYDENDVDDADDGCDPLTSDDYPRTVESPFQYRRRHSPASGERSLGRLERPSLRLDREIPLPTTLNNSSATDEMDLITEFSTVINQQVSSLVDKIIQQRLGQAVQPAPFVQNNVYIGDHQQHNMRIEQHPRDSGRNSQPHAERVRIGSAATSSRDPCSNNPARRTVRGDLYSTPVEESRGVTRRLPSNFLESPVSKRRRLGTPGLPSIWANPPRRRRWPSQPSSLRSQAATEPTLPCFEPPSPSNRFKQHDHRLDILNTLTGLEQEGSGASEQMRERVMRNEDEAIRRGEPQIQYEGKTGRRSNFGETSTKNPKLPHMDRGPECGIKPSSASTRKRSQLSATAPAFAMIPDVTPIEISDDEGEIGLVQPARAPTSKQLHEDTIVPYETPTVSFFQTPTAAGQTPTTQPSPRICPYPQRDLALITKTTVASTPAAANHAMPLSGRQAMLTSSGLRALFQPPPWRSEPRAQPYSVADSVIGQSAPGSPNLSPTEQPEDQIGMVGATHSGRANGTPAPGRIRKNKPAKVWTPEEDALLKRMAEEENVGWSTILKHFPGLSLAQAQYRYCTFLRDLSQKPKLDVGNNRRRAVFEKGYKATKRKITALAERGPTIHGYQGPLPSPTPAPPEKVLPGAFYMPTMPLSPQLEELHLVGASPDLPRQRPIETQRQQSSIESAPLPGNASAAYNRSGHSSSVSPEPTGTIAANHVGPDSDATLSAEEEDVRLPFTAHTLLRPCDSSHLVDSDSSDSEDEIPAVPLQKPLKRIFETEGLQCVNCRKKDETYWRFVNGDRLCNSCGGFAKRNGVPRPRELWDKIWPEARRIYHENSNQAQRQATSSTSPPVTIESSKAVKRGSAGYQDARIHSPRPKKMAETEIERPQLQTTSPFPSAEFDDAASAMTRSADGSQEWRSEVRGMPRLADQSRTPTTPGRTLLEIAAVNSVWVQSRAKSSVQAPTPPVERSSPEDDDVELIETDTPRTPSGGTFQESPVTNPARMGSQAKSSAQKPTPPRESAAPEDNDVAIVKQDVLNTPSVGTPQAFAAANLARMRSQAKSSARKPTPPPERGPVDDDDIDF